MVRPQYPMRAKLSAILKYIQIVQLNLVKKIEQKGMTFDHDFGYSFPLSFSLLKKEGREKKNEVAKIMIKSHAFLLDRSKSVAKNYAFTKMLIF